MFRGDGPAISRSSILLYGFEDQLRQLADSHQEMVSKMTKEKGLLESEIQRQEELSKT